MPYANKMLKKYSLKLTQSPEEVLHRTIESTVLTSYNSPWDPLTELIQNAVDAINQKKALLGDDFNEGKITITVDKNNNTLTVEDNGIGIISGKAEEILLPSGTLKIARNTYGHKGLGLTYCAHICDEIEIESNHTSGTQHWLFKGGFSWINDITQQTTLTDLSNKPRVRSFSIDETGTCIKMKFATGRYSTNLANTAMLESFFDWAGDRSLMPFVLRTRTAIGQVKKMFGSDSLINIIVKVDFKDNQQLIDVPYEYFDFYNYSPLSNQPDKKAKDYLTNIYLDGNILNKAHHGIYNVFESDFENPSKPLKVGEVNGGLKFNAYVYCCGKEALKIALGNYDERLNIARVNEDGSINTNGFDYLAISTDVHLAIDGMPNGTPIDKWDNKGAFTKRYFVMIDAELAFGTILDAGRKTITPHYVSLLTDKIFKMINSKRHYFSNNVSFRDMSAFLNNTRSSSTPRRPIVDIIEKWNNNGLFSNSFVFKNNLMDELGCYLLFGELVGRGIIPGYTFIYVSSNAVYDAAVKFKIDLSKPENRNSTKNNGICKFAIGSSIAETGVYEWRNGTTGQGHLIMEFKVSCEELLKEIERMGSEKSFNDINILVCFDFKEDKIRQFNGSIIQVPDSKRALSGVTHELYYGSHKVDVICLSSIFAELTVS